MPKNSTTIAGNCFICGKAATKIAMKNHILKVHNGEDERCYLIKAEGVYEKNYWLLFTVPLDESLFEVDMFLRRIWCECCGHMSAFFYGHQDLDMSKKIYMLSVGDKLNYKYDFGSTTEILLTIVSVISRKKQCEEICLLARNEPHKNICDACGSMAAYYNIWDSEFLCKECSGKSKNEGALLPIVNSPRMGQCCYDGDQDVWTFDPEKVSM